MTDFGHQGHRGPGGFIDRWGAGPFTIEVAGERFRFEDSDQFGPALLNADNDPTNEIISARSLFWHAFTLWRAQGRRTESDGQTCIWREPKPRKAADVIMRNWLVDLPDDYEKDVLIDVLADQFDSDGYRFARNLETNAEFVPDRNLVDILDDYVNLPAALYDATEVWVRHNGVTVPFKINQRISALGLEGIVRGVDSGLAEVVLLPDGNRGNIAVPVEKCRAL